MNDAWTTSPNARRVLQHADDARPVWLWSQDGQSLIWANASAGLFLAKIKKSGLKHAAPAVPIKGQVSRIIRLGSPGRTSLARVQMQAGDRPVSVTCATTPLPWIDDETALLIVGVDPIAPELIAAAADEANGVVSEPDVIAAAEAPETEAEPEAPETEHEPAPEAPAEPAYADELSSWQDADAETAYEPQPVERWREGATAEPDSDDPAVWAEALEGAAPVPAPVDTPVDDPAETATLADVSRRLSDLVERLAADDALFAPLSEADDQPPVAPFAGPDEIEPVAEEPEPTVADAAEEADDDVPPPGEPTGLYKVTGRGFTPVPPTLPEPPEAPAEPEASTESVMPNVDVSPPVVEHAKGSEPAERLVRALSADREATRRDAATVDQVSRTISTSWPASSMTGSGTATDRAGPSRCRRLQMPNPAGRWSISAARRWC